jgi:hypothetical protein
MDLELKYTKIIHRSTKSFLPILRKKKKKAKENFFLKEMMKI